MSTAGYLALLAKLADLEMPEHAKDAFRLIVEGQLKAEAPDQGARVLLAQRQLAAGVPRADICRQLRERFGVGRAQAYRDIGDALNLSQTMRQP